MNPIQQTLYHLGCAVRHCWRAFIASPLVLAVLCVAALLLLASCKTPTPAPAPPAPVVVTPAPTPAEQAVDAAEAERLDAAAAAAKATALALEHAPASTPAKLASGENAIVQANLPPPTEPALAVAIGRVMTGLNGDIVTAQAEQAKALEDADTLRKRLAKLEDDAAKERKAATELLNSREITWTNKFNEQNKQINQLKIEVDKAKDAVSRKVQFWFGLILRLVAAGLLLVAGLKAKAALATGLGGFEAVKGAVATLALSAAAFTLSWAVSQWWFFWACGGFAVLVFGLWAAHAYAADKAKGTLNKIGAAIDAGKAAPDAKTAVVDLAALKGEMNEPERRLVKAIRKIRQKAVATGEPSPAVTPTQQPTA